MERKVQSPAPLAGGHVTGLQAEMEALGPGHTMGDVAAGGGTANSGHHHGNHPETRAQLPHDHGFGSQSLKQQCPDQPKVVDNEGQAVVGIAGGPGY